MQLFVRLVFAGVLCASLIKEVQQCLINRKTMKNLKKTDIPLNDGNCA